MKRALLILIPSFILATIIFILVQSIFLRGKDKGALQVTAAPQSKVYINGKYLGQTPLCKCNQKDMILTGDYTVKLVPSSGNYSEFQEKITVSKSILTVVDRRFGAGATSEGSIITLQPIREGDKRELLITSIPDKAEVLLDNTTSGFTPLLLRDLTDSDHELTLKKSGYTDKKVRIRTPSGYKLLASIYLGIEEDGVVDPTPTPTQTASPSASPSPTPAGDQITILETPTGFLRVRATGSTTAQEVGRVEPGDTFTLLDEASGWYQIKLPSGVTGWVSSQYSSKQ